MGNLSTLEKCYVQVERQIASTHERLKELEATRKLIYDQVQEAKQGQVQEVSKCCSDARSVDVELTILCNFWNDKRLCSACDPAIGKWHGKFKKEKPNGHFEDNRGYLWETVDSVPKFSCVVKHYDRPQHNRVCHTQASGKGKCGNKMWINKGSGKSP